MSILGAFTFAAGSTELRTLLAACEGRHLTAFEVGFIDTMKTLRRPPSDKQWTVLRRIAAGTPNYEAIAAAGLRALPEVLSRWFPDGRQQGHEFEARNPKRADSGHGSFRINTRTGKWADFIPGGPQGGDLISLAAWLFDLHQAEAARRVASMLGIATETSRG